MSRDVKIIEQMASGSREAARDYYGHCRKLVAAGTSAYAGITDYDREELLHESFVILWQNVERGTLAAEGRRVVNRSHAVATPVDNLDAYFMRIVKNKYHELLRRGDRTVNLDEGLDSMADDGRLPDDNEGEEDRRSALASAFVSLPSSCREILSKFYYEKKSLEQILAERAESLSYNALKTRKSKCLAMLRNRLK